MGNIKAETHLAKDYFKVFVAGDVLQLDLVTVFIINPAVTLNMGNIKAEMHLGFIKAKTHMGNFKGKTHVGFIKAETHRGIIKAETHLGLVMFDCLAAANTIISSVRQDQDIRVRLKTGRQGIQASVVGARSRLCN